MQFLNLFNILYEDLLILFVNLKDVLIPFLAHPTLHWVDPEGSFFDLIVTKNTREDDLIHVACHWIFNEQVSCNLVDSHEHESQLSGRSIFLIFDYFDLCLDPLAFDSQIFELIEGILLLFRLTFILLLLWITVELKHLLLEVLNTLKSINILPHFIFVLCVYSLKCFLLSFKLFLPLNQLFDKLAYFWVWIELSRVLRIQIFKGSLSLYLR